MSTIDLSPGALFAGQFRIVRPLAKGGMGAVYVVEQVATGRERALKLMHPMLVSDAKSIERFEREAQVGSRIESDHVVEVIAAGVEAAGPTPWICMELLRGETLADRLERGVPRREEAIEIVEQLSHALVAAHRAGIVHRDLKPENVFLAESRQKGVPFTLKVLDFGVATLAQSSETGGPKTTQGVGSPLWMAPEQTNVGKVVLATDVWAVGLIAFNLLTGHPYWRTARTPGSTITALLVEIMVEELSPASHRAREIAAELELPPGFDAWFARCLVRDPSHRFADASAAFPPLLEMLSARRTPANGVRWPISSSSPAGQTQPEGFVAEAARAPNASATAFEQTRPGPQLDSSPRELASRPHAQAAPVIAGPLGAGPTAPPSRPLEATQVTPRRAVWPWVLLATFGLGATCLLGLGYSIVRGGQEVARNLEGHFVDPETGATVDLGPDGIHVQSGQPVATTDPEADDPEADDPEADDPEADDPDEAATHEATADEATVAEAEATADETDTSEAHEADEADRADDRDDDERADEEEDEGDDAAERPRRPRVRATARPRDRRVTETIVDGLPAASAAQHSEYRSRVIDFCWRGTFEGEIAPPRARYTIEVRGTAARITPRDTPAQRALASCIASRTGLAGTPSGRYVFMIP